MYEFLEYVLSELKTSFVWVLLSGGVSLTVLGAVWLAFRKKGRKLPWGKAALWVVFVAYCAVVFYATILRGMGGYREWNFHLFRAWREAWNNYSAKNWANVLLNVAMFVPLGVLLPLMWRKLRRWAIPAGFFVSLAIELAQLALGRGICDIDDLFCNTLGTMIGYFGVMLVLSLGAGNRKHGLVFGSLALISVLAIGSIFIVYEVKEYGNLPGAAAYTNNTRGTLWTLECTLPEAASELPVYRTQTRTIADCDTFAEEFRQIIGTEYTTVSYYQEAAYYMDQSGGENGTHFLFVHYLDPGYEYSCGWGDNPVWTDTDRETLENALSQLPVFIPEYAEFAVEGDGWHTFTVNGHVDGANLVDGTLRCRYAADGTIRDVENGLLTYTYHDTEAVLSPVEAYDRLCRGEFYDRGFYERKAPADVRVTSCTLAYEIDTKGFYQPVYIFETASPDGSYADRLMIPAM